MSDPVVDTDVIIRLLTGDDPVKQRAAQDLFEQVEAGALVVRSPDTVIADAVYVLSSRVSYGKSRIEVRDLLTPLLLLPGFRVQNRRMLLEALDLYADFNVDFGDAMVAVAARRSGDGVVISYDKDFNRLPGIERREP